MFSRKMVMVDSEISLLKDDYFKHKEESRAWREQLRMQYEGLWKDLQRQQTELAKSVHDEIRSFETSISSNIQQSIASLSHSNQIGREQILQRLESSTEKLRGEMVSLLQSANTRMDTTIEKLREEATEHMQTISTNLSKDMQRIVDDQRKVEEALKPVRDKIVMAAGIVGFLTFIAGIVAVVLKLFKG